MEPTNNLTPSRRTFLTSVAATGAAALSIGPERSSAATVSPAPTAKTPFKIGAVTYNIAKDWDLATILKNLPAAGIEGVELRTTHAHGVELSLSPEARRDVRKKFQDSPLQLASLGTTCEYEAADPAVLAKQIAETKQWIQLAADVGAASIKVRPNGFPSGVPHDKTLEQIGHALADCSKTAANQGIHIQLEVHGPETERVPNIHRILQHAGEPPALFVCWNSNQTDLEDGGLEANFKLVQHRIGQVHMRDLYEEEYPWQKLVRLLQGINFGGYCYAELGESSCDGVRVLKYFRGMLRSLQA